MLLDQVRRLLSHAHVDLHPVIDLNTGTSVNCYEHPTAMTERAHLRTPGEVFPHACRISRNVDSEHPDPYKAHGPPVRPAIATWLASAAASASPSAVRQ